MTGMTGKYMTCNQIKNTAFTLVRMQMTKLIRLDSLMLRFKAGFIWSAVCLMASVSMAASDDDVLTRYREQVEPILADNCYDCHGDGENKGSLTLDTFQDAGDFANSTGLWWKVVKNLQADLMPPKRRTKLSDEDFENVYDWIKADVFHIDPDFPDPGRATLRRLNRVEYQNTVRDLIGVNFAAFEEFPQDDTGYGFDNIGDVLSISPLLLEKYLKAAQSIIDEAVPRSANTFPERAIAPWDFRNSDGSRRGHQLSFYEEALVEHTLAIEHQGDYRLILELNVSGDFEFDPGRCQVSFSVNGESKMLHEFDYAASEEPDHRNAFRYEFEETLDVGDLHLSMALTPLISEDERLNRLDMGIKSFVIQGPLSTDHWVRPDRYADFFPDGPPPPSSHGKRKYAAKVLEQFARRAYRRPPEPATIKPLVALAKRTYKQPGKTFEEGIARAMVAMLASPRFVFRIEHSDDARREDVFALVDEFTLASRLSYFLWSTMPDETLFDLAERGELRAQQDNQVERMLLDARSDEFVRHFTGQWLQARNVARVAIDPLAVLGIREELEAIREKYGDQLRRSFGGEVTPELEAARARYRELREMSGGLDDTLRNSMREETEMLFEHILREDRSVVEIIDSDYTFLNATLAKHYGIEGVEGDELRRVELQENSPWGGVLTQGTMLVITSNPTRTSPVKRGLYILENILGTPSPPAPPNIPELEASADAFTDHEPTLREVLARHRSDALCSSCHSRIDPLGLAFENFSALGTWRDYEGKTPIDASGRLITGEKFNGVNELKDILKDKYKSNFYRCLAEKLLTYALGRGLDYYDVDTVDTIVSQMAAKEGKMSALIMGVVESAPFQRRRDVSRKKQE
jgi:mono/diheme cytochrome c family protein